MSIEKKIKQHLQKALKTTYQHTVLLEECVCNPTPNYFIGSHTFPTFALAKKLQESPEAIATTIGEWLVTHTKDITTYQVVKGFLNLTLSDQLWLSQLESIEKNAFLPLVREPQKVVIEFSCPNTNKPLHLGHIRNNAIGYALCELMKSIGHTVYRVSVVNDRGIHICKSMLAYKKWGEGSTPSTAGMKGDHFVGKYYVLFDQKYQQQVRDLIKKTGNKEEAKKQAPLLQEVQIMLQAWEAGDQEVVSLWKKMNGWVYEGFDVTYEKLGITFDKVNYESEVYLNGKKIVYEGLEKKVFYQKEDSSIWVDLQDKGLEKKLLMRADGTSVYITQDMGLIEDRYQEYDFDKHIYVVGNEQNYHFKVLFSALEKLSRPYAEKLYHLSYGMVELPTGKMKSREGTTVDADTLIEKMIILAKEKTNLLGKTEGFTSVELDNLYNTIGLSALKYFLLKVNPQKNILFNPSTSIDLQGNTGPFIQYTYVRITTLLSKVLDTQDSYASSSCIKLTPLLSSCERQVIIQLVAFPRYLYEAVDTKNPSIMCTYAYELAKVYNRFYATHAILDKKEHTHRYKRLYLSKITAFLLKKTMHILGINMPERM